MVWVLRQPVGHVVFPIHALGVVNFSCPFVSCQNGLSFALWFKRLRLESISFPPFERDVRNRQGVAKVLDCKGVPRNAIGAIPYALIAQSLPVTRCVLRGSYSGFSFASRIASI